MAATVAALQAWRASSKPDIAGAAPIFATVGLKDIAALQYIVWNFACCQLLELVCFNSEHSALNNRDAFTVHSEN